MVGSIIVATAGVLAVGCVWGTRRGRPQWRDHRGQMDPAVRKAGAKAAALSATTTYWMVEGGGGDGA